MSESLAFLPPRRTARLLLAPLRPAHARHLRAITDDRAITDRIHFLKRPFTTAAARRLIRGAGDRRDRFIGIWRGGSLLGVVGAHLHGADAIEIGYWIARAHHGKGYATEAAAALVRLLDRRFAARRIIAECRPDNRASWRVLAKLGFHPTGEKGARPGRRVLVRRA